METKTSPPLFKKRVIKNRGRKRKPSGKNESSSEDETTVVKKEKKVQTNNPLVQKSVNIRKPKGDGAEEAAKTSSSEDEGVGVSYRSRREAVALGPRDQGATATLEIETPVDRDAQAIFENAIKINKELKGKEDDKVYRGLANYTQFYEKRDTAQGNAASGMVRKGPIRAPANLRATVRWDYQPDICKDYKETGFCGFGDSCKFLHDRTDYKHGWQLEQEDSKNDSGDENTNYEIESDDDHLPFKCFICRESFTDPVVTKCGHYYCEKCALAQYKKSTRCFICNKQTGGMFGPAKEIIARMKGMETKKADVNSSEDSD